MGPGIGDDKLNIQPISQAMDAMARAHQHNGDEKSLTLARESIEAMTQFSSVGDRNLRLQLQIITQAVVDETLARRARRFDNFEYQPISNQRHPGKVFYEALENSAPEVKLLALFALVLGYRGQYFQPDDEDTRQMIMATLRADCRWHLGPLSEKIRWRLPFVSLRAGFVVALAATGIVWLIAELVRHHFLNQLNF